MFRAMRAALLALFAIGGVAAATAASIQAPPCDAQLRPVIGNAGYASRGDRCEGFYERQFSLQGLTFLSFDTGSASAPTLPPQLTLRWNAPAGASTVRIRATSTRHPYRMDAEVDARRGEFSWPTAIPANRSITPTDLAVLISAPVASGERALLPAHVGGVVPAAGEYRLVVRPALEMKALSITIVADGRHGAKPVVSQALSGGYYPPRNPITFRLSFPRGSSGLYRGRIEGTLADGRTTVDDFLLTIQP